MPLSPLFNVGDVSRRGSEFSTYIEGGTVEDDAQQVKISEKVTLAHNLYVHDWSFCKGS